SGTRPRRAALLRSKGRPPALLKHTLLRLLRLFRPRRRQLLDGALGCARRQGRLAGLDHGLARARTLASRPHAPAGAVVAERRRLENGGRWLTAGFTYLGSPPWADDEHTGRYRQK